jgi:hypothetical protein
MELFVKVAFWMGIARVVLWLIVISTSAYPRPTKNSLGSDVATLIVAISFAVWSGYLVCHL